MSYRRYLETRQCTDQIADETDKGPPPKEGLLSGLEQGIKSQLESSGNIFGVNLSTCVASRVVVAAIVVVVIVARTLGPLAWDGEFLEGAGISVLDFESGLEVVEVLGSVLSLHGLEDAVEGQVPGLSLVARLLSLTRHWGHTQLWFDGGGPGEVVVESAWAHGEPFAITDCAAMPSVHDVLAVPGAVVVV